MDLGEFTLCLNVQDLEQSLAFYEKLGFDLLEDHREDHWAVLRHNNLILSLYQGHIVRNLLNFRGGDILAIEAQATAAGVTFTQPATRHPDGSMSAEITDPDGNALFFHTYPDEREQYRRTGKLSAT